MALHFGLPCGTCSRAREKHCHPIFETIFVHLNNFVIANTSSGSHGYEALTFRKYRRFAVRLLVICWELQISPRIENLNRSWLWGVLVQLVSELNLPDFTGWFGRYIEQLSMHACMGHNETNRHHYSPQEGFLTSWRQFATTVIHTCLGRSSQLVVDFLCNSRRSGLPSDFVRMANLLKSHADRLHINMEKDISFARKSKDALGHQTTSASPLIAEFSPFQHSEQQCNIDGYRLLASPLPGVTTTA